MSGSVFAVQDSVTCPSPATAASPVGAAGAPRSVGVANTGDEEMEWLPWVSTAASVYRYVVSLVNPTSAWPVAPVTVATSTPSRITR